MAVLKTTSPRTSRAAPKESPWKAVPFANTNCMLSSFAHVSCPWSYNKLAHRFLQGPSHVGQGRGMGLQRCTSGPRAGAGLTHAHHVGGNGLRDMGGLGDPSREVLRHCRLFLERPRNTAHDTLTVFMTWLIVPIATTIPSAEPCLTSICWRIPSVASLVCQAHSFTSWATTAHSLPASPARAASMVALSGNSLVYAASSMRASVTFSISRAWC